MFTKAEVDKLTKMGINLDELAPNSNPENKLQYGGAIALKNGGGIGGGLINMLPLQMATNTKPIQIGLDAAQMFPITAPAAYLASLPYTTRDVISDIANNDLQKAQVDALGFVPNLKRAKNIIRLAKGVDKVAKTYKKVNNINNTINLGNDINDQYGYKNGGKINMAKGGLLDMEYLKDGGRKNKKLKKQLADSMPKDFSNYMDNGFLVNPMIMDALGDELEAQKDKKYTDKEIADIIGDPQKAAIIIQKNPSLQKKLFDIIEKGKNSNLPNIADNPSDILEMMPD